LNIADIITVVSSLNYMAMISRCLSPARQ
jgi:hypothetical protein